MASEQKEKLIRFYKGTEGEEIVIKLVDLAENVLRTQKFRISGFLDPFGQEIAETVAANYGNIRVDFEVMDADFKLPALTIQPLVENAIRHGVRIREEGMVTVTTRRATEGHEIVIQDNGKGFDTTKARADGGHIGIANVRERLEKLCGGTLSIESTVGEGTRVMIRIPNAAGDAKPNRR